MSYCCSPIIQGPPGPDGTNGDPGLPGPSIIFVTYSSGSTAVTPALNQGLALNFGSNFLYPNLPPKFTGVGTADLSWPVPLVAGQSLQLNSLAVSVTLNTFLPATVTVQGQFYLSNFVSSGSANFNAVGPIVSFNIPANSAVGTVWSSATPINPNIISSNAGDKLLFIITASGSVNGYFNAGAQFSVIS